MKQLSIIACLFVAVSASAGQYFQDFSLANVGDQAFGDGSQLTTTAVGATTSVRDTAFKELRLTEAIGNTRAAFLLPNLDPNGIIYAFSARWNAQISGNFPTGGNGFSFTFGQIGSLSLTNAAYAQESGYPTGICFSVQTAADNNPGFYLRVNGTVVASQPFTSATQWGVNSGARHVFEVDWNYLSGVTVRLNGQAIFQNVWTPGYSFQTGNRFAWAARTGAQSEELRIDNLLVMTGGNLKQVTMTSPYYKSGEFPPGQTADKAFDGVTATKWYTPTATAFVGATSAAGNRTVRAYGLTVAEDFATRDPRVWTLQGSNNGGTNWTTVATGTGSFVNRNETRFWRATNNASFAAFRLNISANNGAADTQLAELRLYEFEPVSEAGFGGAAVPSGNWTGVACSEDGAKVFATRADGGSGVIYASTNAGITWAPTTAPSRNWRDIATSTNGTRLVAVGDALAGGVYNSTNSGATWFQTGTNFGTTAASSADGTKLLIANTGGGIHRYTGTSWTLTTAPALPWLRLASSADGSTLLAGHGDFFGGGVYHSTNSGTTWTAFTNLPSQSFSGLAISADGTHLAACGEGAFIYVSTNSGASWTPINPTFAARWRAMAASPNGETWYAANESYGIFRSTDFGETWLPFPTSGGLWTDVAGPDDAERVFVSLSGGVGVYPLPVQFFPPVLSYAVTYQVAPNSAQIGMAVETSLPASVWVQWGPTTNYGNTTAPTDIPGGGSSTLNFGLPGLMPETVYYTRAVVSNILGIAYSDAKFKTASTNHAELSTPGDSVVSSSFSVPLAQWVSFAVDDSAATKYLNFDKLNTGLTLSPSRNDLPVRGLTLISAEDAPERDPASFVLDGSFDGFAFTRIASNAIPVFAGRNAIQSFAINNEVAYPTYRLTFPTVADAGTANSMQIAEVELLPYAEIIAVSNNIVPPGGSTIVRTGIMDRSLASTAKLEVNNIAGGNTSVDIFPGAAMRARAFEWIGAADDALFPGRAPTSVTLFGFDGTNYTQLHTVNPPAPVLSLELHGQLLTNNNTYQSYRVTFGPPLSGVRLQVGEVRLFGDAGAVPALTILRTGNQVNLRWLEAPGYYLEYRTNLSVGSWISNSTPPNLSGGTNSVLNTTDGAAKFFRLRR